MVAACLFWIYGRLVIALPFPVGMSQCYPIERQLIVINWCGGLHGWGLSPRTLKMILTGCLH